VRHRRAIANAVGLFVDETRPVKSKQPFKSQFSFLMASPSRHAGRLPLARNLEDVMKVLMVITSHDQRGNTGWKTLAGGEEGLDQFPVKNKEVTGFTNGEEAEVGLTKVVPFLVEDEMLRLGAVFSKKADWQVHVVGDSLLITGQNLASPGPTAKTLIAAVKQKATPVAAAKAS
jgi:hypothetical protein